MILNETQGVEENARHKITPYGHLSTTASFPKYLNNLKYTKLEICREHSLLVLLAQNKTLRLKFRNLGNLLKYYNCFSKIIGIML